MGSDPDFRGSRELNWRLRRPGEGQGGPNKSHLDPKITQTVGTKKNLTGLQHKYATPHKTSTTQPDDPGTTISTSFTV